MNPPRKITTRISPVAIAVALFFAVALLAHGATITVTNTNDSGAGSLRQALLDASDGDTITFAVTGTIGLTSGELLVDKSITISGPGSGSLAVDGNATSRVFHIVSGKNVTISGLTITNGFTSGDFPDDSGAGIYNDYAKVTLSNCRISGNFAGGNGGAIYNVGYSPLSPFFQVEITNSTMSGNSAGLYGGAIYNVGTGGYAASVEITNSTLSGNSAGDGGAIYTVGETILEFETEFGGASVALSNSNISGNSAQVYGGGVVNTPFSLYGGASLGFSNCTISGNSAQVYGGGIVNGVGADVGIGNTVLNAGAVGENISNDSGWVYSLGYNLSSDNGGGVLTGPGDQINTDPMLGPLQDNGGPTLTHELLLGSPAIDAGDPNFTPPPYYDQRDPGFWRVRNDRIDIGSFEVQAGTTPTPTPAQINLSAVGRRVQGRHTVDLTW